MGGECLPVRGHRMPPPAHALLARPARAPAPVSPQRQQCVAPARPGRRRRGSPGGEAPQHGDAAPRADQDGRDVDDAATGPRQHRDGPGGTGQREHHAAHRAAPRLPPGGDCRHQQDHRQHRDGQEQFVVRAEGLDGPFLHRTRRQVDDRRTHRGAGVGPDPAAPRAAASHPGQPPPPRYPQPPGRPCRPRYALRDPAGLVAGPCSRDCTARRTRTTGVYIGAVFCHAHTSLGGELEHGDQRQEGRRHRRCVRFGRASAELLASKGAKVAVLDREGTDGKDVASAIGGTFLPSTSPISPAPATPGRGCQQASSAACTWC